MVKYIFCINAGRSGSKTLSKIFESVHGCYSVHEPEPVMNGQPQRRYLNGRKDAIQKLMPKKLLAVSQHSQEVYFESNHSFIKAFGWELMNTIPVKDVGIIVLDRDELEIAKSLQRIHCSPFNIIGRDWIIIPSWKRRKGLSNVDLLKYYMLKILYNGLWKWNRIFEQTKSGIKYPSFIKRAEIKYLLWYIAETKRLARGFFREYPFIKNIKLSTHDLNDVDKIASVITFFGLKVPNNLDTILGIKYNQKIKKTKN